MHVSVETVSKQRIRKFIMTTPSFNSILTLIYGLSMYIVTFTLNSNLHPTTKDPRYMYLNTISVELGFLASRVLEPISSTYIIEYEK